MREMKQMPQSQRAAPLAVTEMPQHLTRSQPGEHRENMLAAHASAHALSNAEHDEGLSLLGRLGSGVPLDGGVRGKLERSFGRDLGAIRVHPASSEASSLGARGFAVGRHVGFAPGAYIPGDLSSELLVAHEVAHALQYAENVASRTSAAGSAARSAAELESSADRAAVGAVQGRRVDPGNGRPGLGVRRCSRGADAGARVGDVTFKHSYPLHGVSKDVQNPPETKWRPGSEYNYVLYARDESPTVTATATTGMPRQDAAHTAVDVKVNEGSSMCGMVSNVSVRDGAVQVPEINLSNLKGSNAVGKQEYEFTWYYRLPGGNWREAGRSGTHHVLWMFGRPRPNFVSTEIAYRIASRGQGLTEAKKLASKLRSGIQEIDGISYDSENAPVFSDNHYYQCYVRGIRSGDCFFFANLLSEFARTAGFDTDVLILWSGFWYGSRSVLIITDRSGTTSVRGSNGPREFPVHALTRFADGYHDAAMNVDVIHAASTISGRQVEFLDVQDAYYRMPRGTRSRHLSRARLTAGLHSRAMGPIARGADVTRNNAQFMLTSDRPNAASVTWSLRGAPDSIEIIPSTGELRASRPVAQTYMFEVLTKLDQSDDRLAPLTSTRLISLEVE